MQYHLNGYATGDPLLADPHPSVARALGGAPRADRRPHRRLRTGRVGARGAARRLPRHPPPRRRAPGRSARRSARPTASPAARSRCSRRSAWPSAWCARRTGSTRSPSGGPTRTDPSRITRTGRVQDVEDGLSEFPHVIVNQARMQDYLLRAHARSASRLDPDYGLRSPASRSTPDGAVPGHGDAARTERRQPARGDVRAKYVVGCDGARSASAPAIGRELRATPRTRPGA